MSLKPGSDFPRLPKETLRFLKGEPTEVPVPGAPTVVELWAQWCGPCRQVFPHLTAIARKYKDQGLHVVGISIDASPGIEDFVASQGDSMGYAVAVSQEAGQSLMRASGQSGIPTVFAVDARGKLLWTGHPMAPECEDAIKKATATAPAAAPRELPRITQSREELSALPGHELKRILQERGIAYADLHEKPEFVDRILERCSTVAYSLSS